MVMRIWLLPAKLEDRGQRTFVTGGEWDGIDPQGIDHIGAEGIQYWDFLGCVELFVSSFSVVRSSPIVLVLHI